MAIPEILEQAMHYYRLSNLPMAEAACRQALSIKPAHGETLSLLGVILFHTGRYGEGLAQIEKACKVAPTNAIFISNLGSFQLKRGEPTLAERACRRAIALQPLLAVAHSNLAAALSTLGRLVESIVAYEESIKKGNDDPELYLRMVWVHIQAQDWRKAIKTLAHAGSLLPDDRAIVGRMAALRLLAERDHLTVVMPATNAAEPTDHEIITGAIEIATFLITSVSQGTGNTADALYLLNVASALCKAQGDDEAKLEAHICSVVGVVYTMTGESQLAASALQRAYELAPHDWQKASSYLFMLLYSGAHSDEEVFRVHLEVGKKMAAAAVEQKAKAVSANTITGTSFGGPSSTRASRDRRKIRLGFVSADFRRHVVAHFIKPIFQHYAKSQFEVFCYHNSATYDTTTQALEGLVDNWACCLALDDVQLFQQIQKDHIDILIDLSGHSAGNRLAMFAMKPAPLQMTWIGYAGTTGLAAMDYRITDALMDPPGIAEFQHTEKLLRLQAAASFTPHPKSPGVNELPSLSAGVFTFAALNNPLKLTPEMIHIWARILQACPNSRLFLGYATDSAINAKIKSTFGQHGIDETRIIIHPKMVMDDFLKLHHEIDLALDTYPYNGGTTSCHALWMGVPVISLYGKRPVSRVGMAVLAPSGLGAFAVDNAEAYIQKAVALAADKTELAQLRRTLRKSFSAAFTHNEKKFTADFESAIKTLWLSRQDSK